MSYELHYKSGESQPEKPQGEPQYPCDECGAMRTKAEGGTTFSVCDACWDKKYPSKPRTLIEKSYQTIVVYQERELAALREVVGKCESPLIYARRLIVGTVPIADCEREAAAKSIDTALAAVREGKEKDNG